MNFTPPQAPEGPDGRVGVLVCRETSSADEIAELAMLARQSVELATRIFSELIIVIHFDPERVQSQDVRQAIAKRNNGQAEFEEALDDDDRTLYWNALVRL